MAISATELRALGGEIRRRRKALRLTQADVEERTKISQKTLSSLERGYNKPEQGFSVPSDDFLDALGAALDIPISRLHMLLGRFPDQPFPFKHPNTLGIAERYDALPDFARPLIDAQFAAVEAMVGDTIEDDKLKS